MNFDEIGQLNKDISLTRKYLANCRYLLLFMKKMHEKKFLTKEEHNRFVEVKLHFERLDLNLSYFNFLLNSSIFEIVKALANGYFEGDREKLAFLEQDFHKEFNLLEKNWERPILN